MLRVHGIQYKEEKKEQFRDGLIWWTNYRLATREDYWIDKAIAQIAIGGAIVVSDVRYPIEADYILSQGGIIIQIRRTKVPRHESTTETSLDSYPVAHIVDNDANDGGVSMFIQLDSIISDLHASLPAGSQDY